MKKVLVIFVGCFGLVGTAFAHSGGTDSNGCHTNHKTGEYHCHKRK
ncbi:YHYH domain-containing protein [Vibrio cholerae]|nr:YHYH domain-containing protein [Vibrio cholerae]EGR2428184.1 YHYH domain-containing protein [Vibrio cholerae]TXZ71595.1 YHYH domain-containing protein [Vibrio cholerae]